MSVCNITKSQHQILRKYNKTHSLAVVGRLWVLRCRAREYAEKDYHHSENKTLVGFFSIKFDLVTSIVKISHKSVVRWVLLDLLDKTMSTIFTVEWYVLYVPLILIRQLFVWIKLFGEFREMHLERPNKLRTFRHHLWFHCHLRYVKTR